MDSTKTITDDSKLYQLLAKIIIQLIRPLLNASDEPTWYLIWPTDLRNFAKICLTNHYPWSYIKTIVERHIESNLYWPCVTYQELIQLYPCEVESNDLTLTDYCQQVLSDNPKSVTDYKNGKVNSINHLKGQVMKLAKGKADMGKVEMILKANMS